MATTNIQFTIQDIDLQDYIDAFGADYQETIDGEPNPQTKAQFAKQQAANVLASEVLNYRKAKQRANLASVDKPNIT